MKYQPGRNYSSNDNIMTPESLAKNLIDHFNPCGVILDPCRGTGSFYNHLSGDVLWCEIEEGRDFFDFDEHVDWIITNPPWSKIRKFLIHSMELSDNVCFLSTINHLWTKARIRDIKDCGFGIKEIVIFDTPENFPQSGFQVGMFHLKKDYKGSIEFSEL
jgi:hypothetical protein